MKISRRFALCAGVTGATVLAGGAGVWATASTDAAPRVVAASALRIGSADVEPATAAAAGSGTEPAAACTTFGSGMPAGGSPGPFEVPAFNSRIDVPADAVKRINAETQALVDYLHDHGVEVSTTTDDQGIITPDIPSSTEVRSLIERYFHDKFGDPPIPAGGFGVGLPNIMVSASGGVDGPGTVVISATGGTVGDIAGPPFAMPDLPQDVKERIAADNQALLAALTEAGIDARIVDDPTGVGHVEWDFTNDAANAVAETFFKEHNDGFVVSGSVCGDGPIGNINVRVGLPGISKADPAPTDEVPATDAPTTTLGS